jgi:hypothetical protein
MCGPPFGRTEKEQQGSATSFGRRKGDITTLDEALKMVKERYGLLPSYVTGTGQMMYVVGAEKELRAIRGVKLPEFGIALLAPEVIELACGTISIEDLSRKKNPELFAGGAGIALDVCGSGNQSAARS